LFVGLQVRARPVGERFQVDVTARDFDEVVRLEALILRAAETGALGDHGRVIAVNDMFGGSLWRFTGVPSAEGAGGISGATEFVQRRAGV